MLRVEVATMNLLDTSIEGDNVMRCRWLTVKRARGRMSGARGSQNAECGTAVVVFITRLMKNMRGTTRRNARDERGAGCAFRSKLQPCPFSSVPRTPRGQSCQPSWTRTPHMQVLSWYLYRTHGQIEHRIFPRLQQNIGVTVGMNTDISVTLNSSPRK